MAVMTCKGDSVKRGSAIRVGPEELVGLLMISPDEGCSIGA